MICDLVRRMSAAAAAIPVAIVFSALGGGVVLGRAAIGLLLSLAPSSGSEAPTPRHHAERVRDRATAAAQAARASGLLKRDN